LSSKQLQKIQNITKKNRKKKNTLIGHEGRDQEDQGESQSRETVFTIVSQKSPQKPLDVVSEGLEGLPRKHQA
jgi:hypothetical protein